MSTVVYNDTTYTFFTEDYERYREIRLDPKVSFESDGGYLLSRNRWSAPQRRFEIEGENMPSSEHDAVLAVLNAVGSDTFWYIPPENAIADGAATAWLCRVISDEIEDSPIYPAAGQVWRMRVVLRSIGPSQTILVPA